MLSKYYLGVKLMSWGAKLCLNSTEDKEKLKQAINGNTALGSAIDSGGHICDHIKPMCDYDTQSVINVFKQELLINGGNQIKDSSKKETWYKEIWN